MPAPLLTLSAARLRQGGQLLFDGIDLAIGKGDRVCLVGRNGVGKSTLLRVLAGRTALDEGDRFVQPRTAVAYLPQEPSLQEDITLRAAVEAGLPNSLREGEAWRAERLLDALGLDADQRTLGLSGGEARRVSLARALVAEPDILLLDEPTNHLDIAAIEWLEAELDGFKGGLVLISHDRALLARLSRRTWWLDRGRLHVGETGYAGFETWSEALLAAEETALDRLNKRLAAETHWLHRGVTARRRRNLGRLRKLEQLRDARRKVLMPQGLARLEASAGPASGRLVIEAKGLVKRFAGRAIVDGFSTRILRGDRVGVIGPNGAGKTTLLNLLLGELAADAGTVRLGTNLEIARFDQQRSQLDPDRTLWDTLCPAGGDQVEVRGQWRHVVGYLRDFLFRDDQARQPVRSLSGGERNRLLLARILARPANLLVLDEPTNDLDMDTLDLLLETFADYQGTLLLVSHDRDFLDRLVTSTIAFEGAGRWREYAGGYRDVARQRPPIQAPAPSAPRQRPTAPRRAPGFASRLQRELDRLPDRLSTAQAELERVEQLLADPDLYRREPERFAAASSELEHRRVALARLEERWLELETLREQAQA